MKDTNKKLKVSQGLPDWKAYLDFVNNIIVGGLKKIVVKSCAALEQQLDPVHLAKPTALGPMLEIELDLIDGAVFYSGSRVLRARCLQLRYDLQRLVA